ncbi:unnamed protein product [Notodromas monacha]|uniref:Potassium channel domain-containing protein n=1 Tax=Notodromas monacha TaxID=399045 RepID=A0A7R9GEW2_9CRUS|nr:unnamed protein product [Notodromas monacha]CAG0920066.1 unnamed protein product [Notodromas monacha]
MSTIGFGDIVPEHEKFMMASFVYLLFGLALTSMCINVVQESISSAFSDASEKLRAAIGMNLEAMEDEDGTTDDENLDEEKGTRKKSKSTAPSNSRRPSKAD